MTEWVGEFWKNKQNNMYVGGTSFGRFLFSCPKGGLSLWNLQSGILSGFATAKATTRLGKLGLYAASKRTHVFYQKKDSLILALSKGPTSFSEALEKAFLEYSRDWFLNNRQYETCRDQDLARWHRFADWFFEQGYQILKTRLCSADFSQYKLQPRSGVWIICTSRSGS